MYNDWDNAHVGMYILRRFKVIMSNHGDPEYRKIPKISPGAYIFQRPFLRGLSMEGNLRFKIDWASLTVEGKFYRFCFVLLCI